jgi:hypothetical protein
MNQVVVQHQAFCMPTMEKISPTAASNGLIVGVLMPYTLSCQLTTPLSTLQGSLCPEMGALALTCCGLSV